MYCKLTHFFPCSIVNSNMNCEIKGQYYNTIEINWTLQHNTRLHIYYTELQSQGKQNTIYPICTCKICSDGRTSVKHKSTHFVHTHNKYLNTSLQLCTRKTN